MKTHRFCCPDAVRDGDEVRIEGPAAAQIRRVLRLAPGDRVILFGTDEWEYCVCLEELRPTAVTGRIVARALPDREPGVELTLAFALLKGERTEWVLQKGTELGVTRFLMMQTERTIVSLDARRSRSRLERYTRIVGEATEQSGRSRPPSVEGVHSFLQALTVPTGSAAFLLHTEASQRLSACLQEAGLLSEPLSDRRSAPGFLQPESGAAPDSVLSSLPIERQSWRPLVALFIGPEGGFTEEEMLVAVRSGLCPASLGPRILRAETAALAAVTLAVDLIEARSSPSQVGPSVSV